MIVEVAEADYNQTEGQGGNVIVAHVLYNRDIVNPITVTFFPVTYTQYRMDVSPTLPPGFPMPPLPSEPELEASGEL